jgi:hypothetical protein
LLRSALAFLALALAGPASAAEVGCWFEKGAVVATARVAGVTGDFIVDTGAPRTVLHETKAQAEGFGEEGAVGAVELAGVRVEAIAVGVADLDARTYAFTTPIAGLIGLDALAGQVVDVSFEPCRLGVHRPGAEPRLRGRRAFDLPMQEGAVMAAVTDGERERRGPFRLSTGADLPIRLDEAVARVPGAAKPDELFPEGVWRARLSTLRFANETHDELEAGLLHAGDAGDVLGVIGTPILSAYRLRFDFPRRRVFLLRPPDVADRPRPAAPR